MSFLLEQNMKLGVWHAIIHLMIIFKQQHYYQLIAGDIIFLPKEVWHLLNMFQMSELPMEHPRRRMGKWGNLYFNSSCFSPKGKWPFWRVWVIIEWCHHLVVIKQYCWLDHCPDHWVLVTSYNPPISSIQNVKGWKYCCRLLFIFLTQKHYLQFERVCFYNL